MEQKTEPHEEPKSVTAATEPDTGTNSVDFTENDSSNPLNWPKTYKWCIVVLTACLSTVVYVLTDTHITRYHVVVNELT